jgi:extracellular matrix protein 14
MRPSKNVLLALLALLTALVVAVPSPAYLTSTSLTTQRQPLWKSVSSRIIKAIWGIDEYTEDTLHKVHTTSHRTPSSHTLARYGGDVVVRFNISTTEEAASLAEAADTLLLDVWEFSHDWVDIRLAKDLVPSLLGLLPSSLQPKHTPLLSERDLAQAIIDTYPAPPRQALSQPNTAVSHLRPRPLSLQATPADNGETNKFFADYQQLSVIEPWMRLLSHLFATHVRMISIGTSYEGRDIPALRVGVHPTNDEDPDPPKRRTIIITGGVHAREWISTSTVNYVAYSLITGYGKVQSITKLLEDFDFVFVPTLNPDGYVYSWDTDRLWRKNRQRTNVRFCQGIDLDRGYGFEWDAVSTAGNPCSENFAGESPFEAVESKRLADWAKLEVEMNNVEFVGFMDLHSYSQQILYPYSYSCKDSPPGQENLEELAVGLEKAIRLSDGHAYDVLAACEGNFASVKGGRHTLLPRIEAQGGSALDWFYHEMRVRYAYQIKLRDRGTYGFLLPKENIIPTGKEILSAVLHFGYFLQDEGVKVEPLESQSDSQKDEPTSDTFDSPNPVEDISSQEDGDEWVVVEDLLQEELMEDTQWELRRRRKR